MSALHGRSYSIILQTHASGCIHSLIEVYRIEGYMSCKPFMTKWVPHLLWTSICCRDLSPPGFVKSPWIRYQMCVQIHKAMFTILLSCIKFMEATTNTCSSDSMQLLRSCFEHFLHLLVSSTLYYVHHS